MCQHFCTRHSCGHTVDESLPKLCDSFRASKRSCMAPFLACFLRERPRHCGDVKIRLSQSNKNCYRCACKEQAKLAEKYVSVHDDTRFTMIIERVDQDKFLIMGGPKLIQRPSQAFLPEGMEMERLAGRSQGSSAHTAQPRTVPDIHKPLPARPVQNNAHSADEVILQPRYALKEVPIPLIRAPPPAHVTQISRTPGLRRVPVVQAREPQVDQALPTLPRTTYNAHALAKDVSRDRARVTAGKSSKRSSTAASKARAQVIAKSKMEQRLAAASATSKLQSTIAAPDYSTVPEPRAELPRWGDVHRHQVGRVQQTKCIERPITSTRGIIEG